MEELVQDPVNVRYETTKIPKLGTIKQNLDSYNSHLEKDLLRLHEENQVLLIKIQEKEKTVQSLAEVITLTAGQAQDREKLSYSISEKERGLRVGTGGSKADRGASRKGLWGAFAASSSYWETAKSTAVGSKQDKDLDKVETLSSPLRDCPESKSAGGDGSWDRDGNTKSVTKYQEILKKMEKENEVLILEKEVFRAQNNSSQIRKLGSVLVGAIQSKREQTSTKKEKRTFWYWHFQTLIFTLMISMRLLGCMFFYLQYRNPDLLVDTLPRLMSRNTLKRLQDILRPFLTLEVEEVLPH
ncbi:LOW QUALITY PROTEIN: transmembrane and coiled-coil domain-containing protein 5B-like [Sorex araneus]|uniref:LOW QUALITY PROTEIN: transmembrane and coiled-coil domain-containing protein 5B-like n=1 Tax=Sorex araneus TaxID=42254 RepID=UPI002433CBBC|nr:LOW QUALITY PROTEIN: transmembrane and coiled-coil domain-containing protein 5B-like [Sorex araneus]